MLGGLVAALAALAAVPAIAADGTKTINMAKVTAGGFTPGDAPGFPLTISRPGSYTLAGNLNVPNGNTTAIEITADHVTLDLNGFAILGPADCSGGNPCVNVGTGRGISTPSVRFNLTIRNGTIQGMGREGVYLQGDSHLVEYLHVRSNGNHGVWLASSADLGGSIVQHCTVQRNGSVGIYASDGMIRHNVVNTNLYAGVGLGRGSAVQNLVTRNGVFGLSLSTNGAGAFGNVLGDNPGGNFTGFGVNLGQNLCTGAGGGC
jgi:hypothetical protein